MSDTESDSATDIDEKDDIKVENKIKVEDVKENECSLCGRQFEKKSGYISHVKYCKDKNLAKKFCKSCNEQFYKDDDYRRHMRRQHSVKKKKDVKKQDIDCKAEFECTKCDRRYYDKGHLMLHMKKCNGLTLSKMCKLCNIRFSSENNLRRHMRRRHNRKPEEIPDCESCGKSFSRKCDRSKHINLGCRETKKTVICEFCGAVFSCVTDLNKHVKKGCSEQEKKEHHCGVCQKVFSQQSVLEKHVKLHSGEKIHVCEKCGNSFKHRDGLNRHLRKHAGVTYPCTLCEKKFTASHTLKRHMLWHRGERPFICELCGSTFRERSKLTRHMTVHAGKRIYPCEICQKKFILREHLKAHQRIHTARKSFACNLCAFKGITQQSLKVHQKRHFMNRDFQCNICERTFTQKHSLIKHKKMHERIISGPNRPAYITKPSLFCKHCPKGFTTQRGLVRHTQKHTRGILPILMPGRANEKKNDKVIDSAAPPSVPSGNMEQKDSNVNSGESSTAVTATDIVQKDSLSETGMLIKGTCSDLSDLSIAEGIVAPATKQGIQTMNNDVFSAVKWSVTDCAPQENRGKGATGAVGETYQGMNMPSEQPHGAQSGITRSANAMTPAERTHKHLREPVFCRDSAFGVYTPLNMACSSQNFAVPDWTACRFSQPQDLSSTFSSFQKGEFGSKLNSFQRDVEKQTGSMTAGPRKVDYEKNNQSRHLTVINDKHLSFVRNDSDISDDDTILDNDIHYNNATYAEEKDGLQKQSSNTDGGEDFIVDVQCNKCNEKFYSFQQLKKHLTQMCKFNNGRKEHTIN